MNELSQNLMADQHCKHCNGKGTVLKLDIARAQNFQVLCGCVKPIEPVKRTVTIILSANDFGDRVDAEIRFDPQIKGATKFSDVKNPALDVAMDLFDRMKGASREYGRIKNDSEQAPSHDESQSP